MLRDREVVIIMDADRAGCPVDVRACLPIADA
jgi:hypothetical protein